MNRWQTLADAFIDEDRRLRRLVAACPPDRRERRGPDDALSVKETLGHIAFWDDFAVRFLGARLDPARRPPAVPVDFDAVSRGAIAEAARLPFGEVLARYLEATGALVAFLANNWERMDAREREGFGVPLEHRRHHRAELERAADARHEADAAALRARA